ncbi:MAG TPA: cytochrome P450 [Dongiaceae bacterium]|jgi:cytochrome P450|nr:cytochrome P450 [Dongiaceae bacterium]
MAFADEITVAALEADPYPIFARLRRESPVAWVPAANVWFVTRWSDVERVTKNTRLFAAEVATSPVDRTMGSPTILTCDGPAHDELRRGFDTKYKPRAVADYIDALAKPIVAAHLDRIAGRLGKGGGEAELMSDYFEPASSLAVARSLGFAEVDSETLLRWFHGLAVGAANYENDPAKQAIADRTSAEIDAAILPAIARLERAPDDSAVSHMLHDGMPAGQTRARDFLLPSIKVALLGGMQEPGHGAATVLVGLLTHPAQKRALLADMDTMLPKAVDEGLRWVAPIGTQMRQATEDTEIGGVAIPKGAPVAALISSAGRDEGRYENPDAFDIHRKENGHAAYGFGTHFCAGRWFAQRLMPLLLRPLLERLPDLALVQDQPPVFRGWEFRAPAALHVTFGPR